MQLPLGAKSTYALDSTVWRAPQVTFFRSVRATTGIIVDARHAEGFCLRSPSTDDNFRRLGIHRADFGQVPIAARKAKLWHGPN
jgi:hypothetical protein